MSAIKTSITVDENNWKRLKNQKNRSRIINAALDLYFSRESFFKKAEKDFWNEVDASLSGRNQDFFLLSKGDEELTDDVLESRLWNS